MDFIEVNGVGLRYQLAGSGLNTVVLIHEMGGSLESWDQVVPVLAAKWRVLAYDTRGAGLSEKVRGALGIDVMADDLAALLDALAIGGKIALAGVAVGGAIALHMAVRFPQRVAAVIVGSPAITIAPDRRAALLARVDRLEREGMRTMVADAMANGYLPELRTDGARFAAFRARWLGNDPGSYAAIYRMLVHLDMTHELSRIHCPVLVIAGSLDRTRSPALVEPVARAIAGARYRVLGTGHYMAVETPDLVAVAVNDFLDAVGY
jgi:3-oxoadipate enol-lactonase